MLTVSENLIEKPSRKQTIVFFDRKVCKVSENLVNPINNYRIIGKVFSKGESFNLKSIKKQLNNKITHKNYKNLSIFDILSPVLNPEIDFEIPQDISFPDKLYDYQVQGIKFLIVNNSALLADQMGTGKTVQSVTATRILFIKGKIKKAVFVVPSSLLSVWQEHISKWAPELLFVMVNERKEIRKILFNTKAHIYVVSYDTLKNEFKNEREFLEKFSKDIDLVLLDEAHNIKNKSALKTKAVKFISKNAKYRWALTGTPIQNNIKEFISLYEFLFPNKKLNENISQEEVKQLIKPIMLRRLKKDVLKQLPEKMPPIIEKLELSALQKQEYEYILGKEQEKIINLMEKHKKDKNLKFILKQNIIQSLQRLRQICNFPSTSIESPKAKRLKEIVEEIVDNDEKVIIFTNFYSYGVEKIKNYLEKVIKNSQIITFHGRMKHREKNKAVKKFKQDKDYKIFIGTIGAAGEGLTLTNSSYVIFFDMHWNPAKMWQAEDRVHRIGQKNKVIIHTLITKDTVEEKILQKIEEKKKLINNIVDSVKYKEENVSLNDLLTIIGIGEQK